MRKLQGLLQVVLLACLPLTGWAQTQESGKVSLEDQMRAFEVRLEEFRTQDLRLARVKEGERDLMVYRRAERGRKLLQELNILTREVAKLPEDDPRHAQLVATFGDDLTEIIRMILRGIEELGQYISKLSAEVESESGAKRVAREAYLESVKELRVQYYESLGDVIEAKQAVGLSVSEVQEQLADQLYFFAEVLAGRVQYSGAALAGLRSRTDGSPDNTEVAEARSNFEAKHAQELERLATISTLLGKLGLDNAEYQSLLLRYGQSVSVRDIDGAVVKQRLQEIWESVRAEFIQEAPDQVLRFLIFLFVLLIFFYLSRLARRLVLSACEKSGEKISTLLKDMLATLAGGAVIGVGLLIALSQLGITLGPMLAGLGVAGFIVGFALQDTLGNFAAGGMILIYRPYDVGDVVEVAGAFGVVKKMNLVSTTITTFDNQTLVVPNSKIWGDVIKNVTAQKVRRVDMEFGISYTDDIEKAEKILHDIIVSHESVLSSPEPIIKLHELADSSVNFVVRPWVRTSHYWDVYWDVTREVKQRFDREGISIPFPQRDVHIYHDTG